MRIRRLAVVVLGTAAAALACAPAGAEEAAGCQKWVLEVTCTTTSPRVVLGQEFSATVVAKNAGTAPLEKVTIRLRGDQGAPCVSGPGGGVVAVVERLEPGQSKELSARFAPETMGIARILGSARDSLGWASGACACTLEIVGLAAIEVDMKDQALDGSDGGIFKRGEEFFYVFDVRNDGGTVATPELEAVLELPRHLQFVSGKPERGVRIAGSGQSVKVGPFVLGAPDQGLHVIVRVRVVDVPPLPGLVKSKLTVQATTGVAYASDTESTTLRASP